MQFTNVVLSLILLTLLAWASYAQAQANLEINTPAVAALQASMQKRYAELAPLYANGAVGLTRDGLVALRDPNAVALAQRPRANNKPEWENDIRATFAQRWIDKAQGGWYYQTNAGAWTRK